MDYWITKILLFILIVNVYSQQFFNTMPPPVNTNFTCRGRDTGFYADVETNCRVYHTCDENGNKFTYYCPAETAFRQEALVCDHAHLVDCSNGRRVSRVDDIDEKTPESTEQKIRNDGRYSSSSFTSSKDSSLIQNGKVGDQRMDFFQPRKTNFDYTRSFRIIQEPNSQLSTPKSPNRQQPTFILSSSVFLRDTANFKKNPKVSQNNNRVAIDDSNNLNNSEQLTSVDTNKKEENKEVYSRIFASPIFTTTTFRPFGVDVRMKEYFRNPTIIRSTTLDKKEESTEAYSDKFSFTTTKRPFVMFDDNHRVKGNSGEPHRYEKFKITYEDSSGNARNLGSRRNFDDEKMSSSRAPIGFQVDEKRTRDEKTETGGNFNQKMISEKEFEFETQGRNREGFGEFFEGASKDSSASKDLEGFDNNTEDLKISRHQRPPLLHDHNNFPYSETLRSMQAVTEKSLPTNVPTDKFNNSNFASTTSSPITIAGTEFPVHPFAGTFSPLGPNELDDDPYYPKRSTTTEVYYKLSDLDGEEKKPFRFSTKRPWPGSLNFEIPEVLPDLNTLDDLVDRRKYFYIPRVKNQLNNRAVG